MQYSAGGDYSRNNISQEADSHPTIYCDMDGVLCDFSQGIANMFKLKSKDPSMILGSHAGSRLY